jgi:hypothetical protein
MSLRAPKWLLPLLAVVLTFGGGPMAWAKLVPHGAAPARDVVTAAASQAASSAHCSEVEQGGSGSDHAVPGPSGDDRTGSSHSGNGHAGDGKGCCAAGSCHCACPASMSGQFAPLRGWHEYPAAPADAVRTLTLESRLSRLLRPPIS